MDQEEEAVDGDIWETLRFTYSILYIVYKEKRKVQRSLTGYLFLNVPVGAYMIINFRGDSVSSVESGLSMMCDTVYKILFYVFGGSLTCSFLDSITEQHVRLRCLIPV